MKVKGAYHSWQFMSNTETKALYKFHFFVTYSHNGYTISSEALSYSDKFGNNVY